MYWCWLMLESDDTHPAMFREQNVATRVSPLNDLKVLSTEIKHYKKRKGYNWKVRCVAGRSRRKYRSNVERHCHRLEDSNECGGRRVKQTSPTNGAVAAKCIWHGYQERAFQKHHASERPEICVFWICTYGSSICPFPFYSEQEHSEVSVNLTEVSIWPAEPDFFRHGQLRGYGTPDWGRL